MSNSIEFNNVWKKFKKGEKFNSLRDAIPNVFKKAASVKDRKEILESREFWAVKNVSFSIEKGGVVGIMGPNGAGKSTILKLLSRIIAPNKGSMQITGKLSALIEVTAGFHPELTGRENVYLNGTILGMKKREIDQKFDTIVDFSGIKEFIDTPVKRYSSGMFSRLGFSVAAHMNPDVLLVDEVLSVGDIAFQAKCAEKMRELLSSGVTIVLVSHNLSLIQSLCKRVILLNKGEVLKEGLPDDVIPYYENIVFKRQEEEFKQKLQSSPGYKVKLDAKEAVQIENVSVMNEKGVETDKFDVGENISIDINYDAKEKIVNPTFFIEIMRSDGVHCFSSKTSDSNFEIKEIYGKGKISVDMGKVTLAPAIYVVKISIWDKDLIHPYAVRKRDVLRIEANQGYVDNKDVFLHPVKWTR